MKTRTEYLKDRADRMQGVIWDLEYELTVHELLEMAELMAEEKKGKKPTATINGVIVDMRQYVEDNIRLKKEKLAMAKKEMAYLEQYIKQLQDDAISDRNPQA